MPAIVRTHDLGLTWLETGGMVRSSHALVSDGKVWLIDPFEDQAALAAAAQLGTPAAVIQLLDRHNRDCATIAGRLGIPYLKTPASAPDTLFAVVDVISRPWWREVALWWEAERALVVAEAIGTAPFFALGRRAGVHPMLRLTPPTSQLSPFDPERLLVGHGEPIESSGKPALRDALAHARTDIPKLVIELPGMLRNMR